MPDGKSLISGWSDGRIRAYGPQTGKLEYTIINAHCSAGARKGAVDTVSLSLSLFSPHPSKIHALVLLKLLYFHNSKNCKDSFPSACNPDATISHFYC